MAPPPVREEARVVVAHAVVEPQRVAPRSVMSDSKAALKNEVRQVSQSPRRASAPVAQSSPQSQGGNSKIFLFMAIGIVAGAVAAVCAAKFLLDL